MQNVQEKPREQLDLVPAFEEHVRTLTRVRELLEDTSERIRDLPR